MKKTVISLILLILVLLPVYADTSIKSKIDPVLLSYLENRTNPLPAGMNFIDHLTDAKGRIEVIIVKNNRTVSGSIPAEGSIETQLRSLNVEVLKVRKESIECRATGNSIMETAANPEVELIKLPNRPEPEYKVTQGRVKSGASVWHPIVPYRARKVKVCILDGGFKGYKDLLGKTLPSNVTVKSFRSDGDIETDSVHGAGCAEIVHAMAPDAELYFANIGNSGDVKDALDWIIENKIDVVSFSMGWKTMGPGNGKDPLIKVIEDAIDKGVVFIKSAGNSASSHWSGTFNDTDGDGFHNFENGSNMLEFTVPAERPVSAYLKWNSWGTYNPSNGQYSGTDQDYNIHLYAYLNGAWVHAPNKSRVQDGNDLPVEYVGRYSANITTKWAYKIHKKSATQNLHMDLYASYLPNPVAAGSITSPGDGAKVFTVGAVDWEDFSIASYSSRGPTLDGRIKPDIAAFTRVTVESYGNYYFTGTSAACPHITGAVALIMSKTPYSGQEALKIITSRSIDKGDAGKDNTFGAGILKLN